MIPDSDLPEPTPRCHRFTKALEGRFFRSGALSDHRRAEAVVGRRREVSARRVQSEAAARKEQQRILEIEGQLVKAKAAATRKRKRQERRLELAQQTAAALVLESAWRRVMESRCRAAITLRRCIRIRTLLDFIVSKCVRRKAQRLAQDALLELLCRWHEGFNRDTRSHFRRVARVLRERRRVLINHVDQILHVSAHNVYWRNLLEVLAVRVQRWWRRTLAILSLTSGEGSTPEASTRTGGSLSHAEIVESRPASPIAPELASGQTPPKLQPEAPAPHQTPPRATTTPAPHDEILLLDPRPRLPPRDILRAWKCIKHLALRLRRKYELHHKAVFGWIRARARIRLHARNLDAIAEANAASRAAPGGLIMKKKLVRALDWSRQWTDPATTRRHKMLQRRSVKAALSGSSSVLDQNKHGKRRVQAPWRGETDGNSSRRVALDDTAGFCASPPRSAGSQSVSDVEAQFPADFELPMEGDQSADSLLAQLLPTSV